MSNSKFKNIRAYRVGWILPFVDFLILYPALLFMRRKTTKGIQLCFQGDRKRIEQDIRHGAFFMTNHRDIVMDAAWLTFLLRTRYFIHPYFGIGNNLFGKWWIEHVVRFLRAFVVIRNGGFRDQVNNATTLSQYIRHLRKHHKSIWLAQREGRAKDGNDLTQPGVLKMLTIDADNFFDSVKELNICPVSISYEYDPCDSLKALEFLQKSKNPDFKKSQRDDLVNMQTGIMGYKGLIHYGFTPCINDELAHLEGESDRTTILQAACQVIDRHIHLNYRIYPGNYVAYDMLYKCNRFAEQYTAEQKENFEKYIQGQIAKMGEFSIEDYQFMHEKMLLMYSNPLKNKLEAEGKA